MNIVVTSPKGTDIMHKIRNPYDSFWVLKRKPKNLKKGDIVWVVKDGVVLCGFYVGRIVYAKHQLKKALWYNPSHIWRIWFDGVISEDELVEMGILDENCEGVIKVKGFQGFRYQWWEVKK